MKNIIGVSVLLMLISCFSRSNKKEIIHNKDVKSYQRSIHTFKDSTENEIGKLYVNFSSKQIIDTLYIIKDLDTLYSIKKSSLFSGNKIDSKIYSEGFYGYKIIMLKSDYIILQYLRNQGKFVSDDINIYWNYSKKRFEIFKI